MKRFLLLSMATAATLTSGNLAQQMDDFTATLHGSFETRYAPAAWKEELHNWSLDQEIARLQAYSTAAGRSIAGYQQQVKKFFDHTDDYHCGVEFFSSAKSFLPFSVKSAEGHCFIADLNEELLDREAFDIEVGDKLLFFGGDSVENALANLISRPEGKSPDTELALAEIRLTHREGRKGDICPQGPIRITVEKATSGEVKTYELAWTYTPEFFTHPAISRPAALHEANPFDPFAKKPELYVQTPNFTSNGSVNAWSNEGFLPELGEVLWSSSSEAEFRAYLFLTEERKRVGFIRIPSFMYGSDAIEEIAGVLALFEREAEALVIDQMNNRGGAAFFMYALLSMLTEKPLDAPLHRLKLTQRDVLLAWQMLDLMKLVNSNASAKQIFGEEILGYPINYQTVQMLRHYYQHIVDEWMAGKTFSDPIHIYNVHSVNPNPKVRFTKPILVLINELDFSAGDFFPAILQDNQRAVLMGRKTAGAGGFVVPYSQDNRLGIAGYILTGSLAYRPNGLPIENLGVIPDIPYDLTKEDLRSGCQPFKKAILQVLEQLIPSDQLSNTH